MNNITNIKVAPNEYITKYSFWRNIQKLLENDKSLESAMAALTENTNILPYDERTTYKYGDVVWFYNKSSRKLFLLRSLLDNNATPPNKNETSGATFEDNGWYCVNEIVDVSKLGVKESFDTLVNDRVYNTHEVNDEYHPFRKITEDTIDDIFLKRDGSNRNRNREGFQIPFTTGFFPSNDDDNVILNGCYRLYDNGYIEYDIIYRFGYRGKEVINGVKRDAIYCNDVSFTDGSMLDKNNINYNQNNRYFATPDAFQMFNVVNSDPDNYSIIDDMAFINRNATQNTYFAKITFPFKFKTMDYMVFNGNMLCNTNGTDGMVKKFNNVNTVMFCNRNLYSITAMLITNPEGVDPISNGGLGTNSFRCKIVGMTEEVQ